MRPDLRGLAAVLLAAGVVAVLLAISIEALLSRAPLGDLDAVLLGSSIGAAVGALATYLGGRPRDRDD